MKSPQQQIADALAGGGRLRIGNRIVIGKRQKKPKPPKATTREPSPLAGKSGRIVICDESWCK